MVTALETRFKPRQSAFIRYYIENGGNASSAAREAGYSPPYDSQGGRLLRNVQIRTEIERRAAALTVASEYSIEQWRRDLMADIERAAASGSHSAVMKGRELLGRHIGALSDRAAISGEEAAFFAGLGAAMQSAFAQLPARPARHAIEIPATNESA